MRGFFATSGSFRVLMIVFNAAMLCFCHPFRNKLYIPLFLGAFCTAFVIVSAVTEQKWAYTAAYICWIAEFAALGVQEMMIQQRRRKAAIESERQDENDRKKRKQST